MKNPSTHQTCLTITVEDMVGMVATRKKGGGKNIVPTNNNDYFRCLGLKVGSDGPNLYEKTIDKLAIYSSTQFKNGSSVVVCLWSEEYIKPEVPVLPDEPTANHQHIWE